MTTRGKTPDEIVASLERDGFARIDCAPRTPGIAEGARVHNAGEQFDRAWTVGTATVVAVLRRGTDERPDRWEQKYGRPNVEVVVQRDPDRLDFADEFTCWADYGTWLAENQPAPVSTEETGR
jgi:hypothetical protein